MNIKTTDQDLEYYLSDPKPEYEFRGQEMIGKMLDEYHIAFYYKDPILVWENGERKIKRPDFTLPVYNNVVIVYVPVADESLRHDYKVYKENNIVALFIKDSNLSDPDWKPKLYDELEETYHQPHNFSTDNYQPP